MGNSLFSSVCRRHEALDFEDVSDATFEFIAVAVHTEDLKKPTKTRRRRPRAAMTSTVAVLPVSIEETNTANTSRLYEKQTSASTTDDEELSFNDRLNMLTWDPECMPSYAKRQEVYVFDEYAPSPCNSLALTPTKTAKNKPTGWFRRAVETYNMTKSRRRTKTMNDDDVMIKTKPDDLPTKTKTKSKSKKRSLRMSLWGKRDTAKSKPYQLPLVSGCSLAQDDEEERFLQTTESWKLRGEEAEPLSETESEASTTASVPTTPVFVTAFDEEYLTSYECDDSESEIEWSTTSSGYFSASEDSSETSEDTIVDESNEDVEFFSSSDALCAHIDDYLCECGDCPVYQQIERAVTSSNCWMNEAERRSLCRILQAYASLCPTVHFQKEMISAAEECLVVFPGDEDAAFNAFVMLGQTKWME
ncbi:hypothetical protein Poli38472_009064 [Pythium oligandrum]|uniref:Uncharacterized protein n=1 Tax=Pythium oligandrum TaxID=41045 RepID=A0A8K1CK18_PYTOL|nr:hypothetical protein Poli38472_009064 [Pythium oligandrum]|eukprot:TMW64897.1 hypothetical protein Poli38472_009064 [Pythium oligandrum]